MSLFHQISHACLFAHSPYTSNLSSVLCSEVLDSASSTLILPSPPEPPIPPVPPDPPDLVAIGQRLSPSFSPSIHAAVLENLRFQTFVKVGFNSIQLPPNLTTSMWSPAMSLTAVVVSFSSPEPPSQLLSPDTCQSRSFVSTLDLSNGLKGHLLQAVLEGFSHIRVFFFYEIALVIWIWSLVRIHLPRYEDVQNFNYNWDPHLARIQLCICENIIDGIRVRWNLSTFTLHLPPCEATKLFFSFSLPLYEDVTRIILPSSIRSFGSYVWLHMEQGHDLIKLGVVFSKTKLSVLAQDSFYWQWLRLLYCTSPMLGSPSQLLRSSRRCVFTLVLVAVTPAIVMALAATTTLGRRLSCVSSAPQALIFFLGTNEIFMCLKVYHSVDVGYVSCLPLVLRILSILFPLLLNNFSLDGE